MNILNTQRRIQDFASWAACAHDPMEIETKLLGLVHANTLEAQERLRDKIAMAALVGLATELPSDGGYKFQQDQQDRSAKSIAMRCYRLADAMLEARRINQGEPVESGLPGSDQRIS